MIGPRKGGKASEFSLVPQDLLLWRSLRTRGVGLAALNKEEKRFLEKKTILTIVKDDGGEGSGEEREKPWKLNC